MQFARFLFDNNDISVLKFHLLCSSDLVRLDLFIYHITNLIQYIICYFVQSDV